LAFYQGVFGNDHSYTAVAALELGRSRMALGDGAAAVPLLELAAEYCQRTLGAQNEFTLTVQAELDACLAGLAKCAA
jgi:hypothetical protein